MKKIINKTNLKWYRLVLPKIMMRITGKNRYLPKLELSKNSISFNLFRIYEQIFFKQHGVKPESDMIEYGGKTYFAFYSFEAIVMYFEESVKSFLRKKYELPIKIHVPVIQTSSGFSVFQSPYLFAIAYDNSASLRTDGTSGTSTQAFTTSGSDRFLVSATMTSNNTVNCTYNSVSLTDSDSIFNSNGWELEGHYLVNPASGSNNFVADFTTGGSSSGWAVSAYSGCKQSGQPDSHTTVTQVTTSPITPTTTVVASSCWLWAGVLALTTGSTSAGASTTLRQQISNNFSSVLAIYDSNATVGTGSQSLSVSISGTITNAVGVVISIAPFATATSNSNFLMFM